MKRFIAGGGPGHHVGCYVVRDAPAWPFEAYSWQALITRISRWLEEVKHDLEIPDLWAELQREAELIGTSFDDISENPPFTLDEQKEIAERLQELVSSQ